MRWEGGAASASPSTHMVSQPGSGSPLSRQHSLAYERVEHPGVRFALCVAVARLHRLCSGERGNT